MSNGVSTYVATAASCICKRYASAGVRVFRARSPVPGAYQQQALTALYVRGMLGPAGAACLPER